MGLEMKSSIIVIALFLSEKCICSWAPQACTSQPRLHLGATGAQVPVGPVTLGSSSERHGVKPPGDHQGKGARAACWPG